MRRWNKQRNRDRPLNRHEWRALIIVPLGILTLLAGLWQAAVWLGYQLGPWVLGQR